MIHFVFSPKKYHHTDRSYLTQWFHKDILVVTDIDINQEKNLEEIVKNHKCKNVIVDLSNNGMPEAVLPEYLKGYTCLSTMFTNWYNIGQGQVHYFPLWMWMFNCRSNQCFAPVPFDAGGAKTLPIMCLNRNPHPHRTKLIKMFDPILDRIVYSYDKKSLPGDVIEPHSQKSTIDIGVGHIVYSQCAVNIVTETMIDRPTLSEKSCKPFVARQIPVLLAANGANQFLSDLGLDMFEDLVPWREWDQAPTEDIKIEKISKFVMDWLNSGTILDDYRKVAPRIERNKQYFHSELFRNKLLRGMPKNDPFKP